jgi:hypothetical protein
MQAYGPRDEYCSAQERLLVQVRYPVEGDLGPRRRLCRGYDVHECRDGRCSLAPRATSSFGLAGTAEE